MILDSVLVKDVKHALLTEGVHVLEYRKERIPLLPLLPHSALRLSLRDYMAVSSPLDEDDLAEAYEEFLETFVLPGVLAAPGPEKWISSRLQIPRNHLYHLFGFSLVPFHGRPRDRINRTFLALVLILKASGDYQLLEGDDTLVAKNGRYRFGVAQGAILSNMPRVLGPLPVERSIFDLMYSPIGRGRRRITAYGALIERSGSQDLKDALTLMHYRWAGALPGALAEALQGAANKDEALIQADRFEIQKDPLLHLKNQLVPTLLSAGEFMKRFGNIYQGRSIPPSPLSVRKWKAALQDLRSEYAE